MNSAQINHIMREFEKQSSIMEGKEEVMNDAMDDVLGEDGDEEERSVSNNNTIYNAMC